MKTYAIEVVELHTYTRTYYVNAESKSEAKKKARNCEEEDASEGTWDWFGIHKIGKAEEHDNDLTDF